MNEYSIATLAKAQRAVEVRCAAKVNLTLDVVGLRPDDYHDLRSVVHTIGLWDTIRLDFVDATGLTLSCNRAELTDDSNLCLRAARAWSKATNTELHCHLALHKTIPSGAGLGGGSSNAAAILNALNALFGNLLSASDLHALAATLGADVPLFLNGGCSLMEGIGERLTPLRPLDGWMVVLQPQTSLSTPRVFVEYDRRPVQNQATDTMLQLLHGKAPLQTVATALCNDLTTAAQRCAVDVSALIDSLLRYGALGASMSGSGSAVFGLFDDEASARVALHSIQKDNSHNSLQFAAVADFTPMGFHMHYAE
jgi:4-diphosphocytidyl-2-C-methyl-D-erythritol kinase